MCKLTVMLVFNNNDITTNFLIPNTMMHMNRTSEHCSGNRNHIYIVPFQERLLRGTADLTIHSHRQKSFFRAIADGKKRRAMELMSQGDGRLVPERWANDCETEG